MRYVRRGTLVTAALLMLFVVIVGYAGILAPHRPLFGWFRVVSLDIDRPGNPVRGGKNIFFVEASCATNKTVASTESGLVLSPRAACAIESAARAHPRDTVFYVHTCPVNVEAMWEGAVPPYAMAVVSMPNVYVLPVGFSDVFERTVLKKAAARTALEAAGELSVARATDLLRYYMLYKYGGVYLDTDVLVLEFLRERENFACATPPGEPSDLVPATVLGYSWKAMGGRVVAEASLSEVVHADAAEDTRGGATIVTRALKKMCDVQKVSQMSPETCGGFHLLPSALCFPVAASEWWRLFDEDEAAATMGAINGSHAVHMWNQHSSGARVATASQQPFAQIARRACPNVVAAVGAEM